MDNEAFKEMYAVYTGAENAIASADTLFGQVEDGERDVSLAIVASNIAIAKATLAAAMKIGYELKQVAKSNYNLAGP